MRLGPDRGGDGGARARLPGPASMAALAPPPLPADCAASARRGAGALQARGWARGSGCGRAAGGAGGAASAGAASGRGRKAGAVAGGLWCGAQDNFPKKMHSEDLLFPAVRTSILMSFCTKVNEPDGGLFSNWNLTKKDEFVDIIFSIQMLQLFVLL